MHSKKQKNKYSLKNIFGYISWRYLIKLLKFLYSSIIIISILISIFSIPFFSSTLQPFIPNYNEVSLDNNPTPYSIEDLKSSNFIWPIPNYTRISSYFGKRTSPTAYASSYHKGIDIPAPPGTNIYAAMSGTVVLAQFNGSGGCTVTIQNGNMYTSYCHVSPNFLVSPGLYIEKGQLIAQVGPKNIYGFADNKYKDSNGNPTNGATTGPHLHFAIRNSSEYLNPLNFFS